MQRLLLAFLLAFVSIPSMGAESGGPPQGGILYGQVSRGYYYNAAGTYRIPVMVLPALGASVTDNENTVVFQDDFTTYVAISSIKMDATMKAELDTKGVKNFLISFFETKVVPEFKGRYPGLRVDPTASFSPSVMGGSLYTFALIPNGSQFANKVVSILDRRGQSAKRIFLSFTHDGYVYVISIEQGERFTEWSAYHLTNEEENTALRQKIAKVIAGFEFIGVPAPTVAAPVAPLPAAAPAPKP